MRSRRRSHARFTYYAFRPTGSRPQRPHTARNRPAMPSSPRSRATTGQLQRSWYMFFFQHPFADGIVPANDLAFIDRLRADWSPGFDAD